MVTVLISLTVWGLAGARDSARVAVVLSRLTSHSRSFSSYTSDYRDCWPLIADPRSAEAMFTDSGTRISGQYFDSTVFWPVPLAPLLYASTWSAESFADPFNSRQGRFAYWYSGSFLAEPEFFSPTTRTGPSQWGVTRAGDVVFADRKALHTYLRFPASPEGPTRQAFGFVDGSASNLSAVDVLAGYPSGVGTWPGGSWLDWDAPGMVTIDGVRGRDRR